MKIGRVFKFAAPSGWNESGDGGRHVFRGPNGEELIVSAAVIDGIGMPSDLSAARQRLLQNAEQSAKNAAAHPALKVTQPFQRDIGTAIGECWSLHAQTHEGDTLFYQAVFCDSRGVLLATLEAPNTKYSKDVFQQFINSVQTLLEGETLVE